MAAELEDSLSEGSELIQSSGGVFEVEDNGKLIFSKKALHRFPANGEIIAILNKVASGAPLDEAQVSAAENVPKPPGFLDWFTNLRRNR